MQLDQKHAVVEGPALPCLSCSHTFDGRRVEADRRAQRTEHLKDVGDLLNNAVAFGLHQLISLFANLALESADKFNLVKYSRDRNLSVGPDDVGYPVADELIVNYFQNAGASSLGARHSCTSLSAASA